MPRSKKLARSREVEHLAPGQRARVFWSGRSQAVRLPKAFRFATDEVAISRRGNTVLLEPVNVPRDKNGWPQAFWDLAGADPEFDLGDRNRGYERGDIFARPRKSRS
jgi:virulence-associated protein VagC